MFLSLLCPVWFTEHTNTDVVYESVCVCVSVAIRAWKPHVTATIKLWIMFSVRLVHSWFCDCGNQCAMSSVELQNCVELYSEGIGCLEVYACTCRYCPCDDWWCMMSYYMISNCFTSFSTLMLLVWSFDLLNPLQSRTDYSLTVHVDICQHRSFDNGRQFVSCGQRQPPLSGAPVNKWLSTITMERRIPPDAESGGIPHLFVLRDIFIPPMVTR